MSYFCILSYDIFGPCKVGVVLPSTIFLFHLKLQNCITLLQQWTIYGLKIYMILL